MEQFTYAKRGYDPEEVDRYISTLEQVIKSYKEKDTAIKNALVNAQIAADNIIKNAEIEAHEMKAKTLSDLKLISDSIVRQKEYVKVFQNEYINYSF